MGFEYGLYLAFILAGTLLLQYIFKISFQKNQKRLFCALLLTAFLFSAWDIWAVSSGHWAFSSQLVTGIFFLNQPIEEILFFWIVPFFYVTVWEIFKKRQGARG